MKNYYIRIITLLLLASSIFSCKEKSYVPPKEKESDIQGTWVPLNYTVKTYKGSTHSSSLVLQNLPLPVFDLPQEILFTNNKILIKSEKGNVEVSINNKRDDNTFDFTEQGIKHTVSYQLTGNGQRLSLNIDLQNEDPNTKELFDIIRIESNLSKQL